MTKPSRAGDGAFELTVVVNFKNDIGGNMPHKILFVDDEQSVLDGVRVNLSRRFSIKTTTSPVDALSILQNDDNFAVIVSDFRMPVMDGKQFLTAASLISPCSVMIMLTGHADLSVVIEMLNQRLLFKFLEKPVSIDIIALAIDEALVEYKRISKNFS